MKKVAFIPTRDGKIKKTLRHFFELAEWRVVPLVGFENIFEAFDTGVKDQDIKADDLVIFCHDDIEILTSPWDFNLFIEKNLEDSNSGFVGLAGTRLLRSSCVWWEDMQTPHADSHLNPLAGSVYHGDKKAEIFQTYFGPLGDVVVMDGLFLAAKGRTVNTIQLKKPKCFPGNWDFYDIFYTSQAHMKGLRNRVIPLQVIHYSRGEIKGKTSWHENREAFADLFKKNLPLHIK
jgi:hypothetical protein